MVGIYVYKNGLKFTGVVAETEEKAWEYLKETSYTGKVNKDAYVIKEIKVIK